VDSNRSFFYDREFERKINHSVHLDRVDTKVFARKIWLDHSLRISASETILF